MLESALQALVSVRVALPGPVECLVGCHYSTCFCTLNVLEDIRRFGDPCWLCDAVPSASGKTGVSMDVEEKHVCGVRVQEIARGGGC